MSRCTAMSLRDLMASVVVAADGTRPGRTLFEGPVLVPQTPEPRPNRSAITR
jgi:hypothetical protein